MKKATALLLLVITLFSCQQDRPQPNNEKCDFGYLNLNANRRYPTKGKPPKDQAPQAPTGSKVIFLDFDGHTVTGTAWNYNGDIIAAHSGLTTEQQATILDKVKIHFADLDVIVTTDSTAYWHALANKRMRVIITQSYEWYQTTVPVAGVAYTNSFIWGDNTPCWVFSLLFDFDIRKITHAISHEAGHTLGMRHHAHYDEQCLKTTDYTTETYPDGKGHTMGNCKIHLEVRFGPGRTPYGCDSWTDDLAVARNTLAS